MKKLFFILALMVSTIQIWAQAPQKMSFGAVVRNSSNSLIVNAPVGMKISILQGSKRDLAVYSETHTVTTNDNGLISLEIGTGIPVTGSFQDIDWASGTYSIETETDPTGGTNYSIEGTSQLLSVPYALFANEAGGEGTCWELTGNAGTNSTINFMGTTDNQDVIFMRNNVRAGLLNEDLYNTSWGVNALNPATSGYFNTASGYYSLYSNTTGERNTANGIEALYANTTGSNNTATGGSTLSHNTIGYYNTATGGSALYYNTTGTKNTASGATSLLNNTTGSNNTASGANSLFSNTSGFGNTAAGVNSLKNNSNGFANTANGYQSLSYNTNGIENTASGSYALYSNSTGYNNTGLGSYSLIANTVGYDNTAIGFNAGPNQEALYNTTALGNNARITANDQIRIGNSMVTSIGGQVGWTTLSDARFKTNIQANVKGLDFIMKLQPVTYNVDIEKQQDFINVPDSTRTFSRSQAKLNKSATQTGFLAQDVERAAKELGYEFSGVDAPKNSTDYYGLRYAEFVVPLVKAMQEQQAMIAELNEKLNVQSEKLEILVSELKAARK